MEKQGMPFQGISPMKDFYTKEVDKEAFTKILEQGGVSINDENITAADSFSTPEFTDKELLELMTGILEIPANEKDLENKLEGLSEILNNAKSYITDELQLKLPKQIQEFTEFKNKKGKYDINVLFDFLRKTKTLGKGKRLAFYPLYCALTTLMISEIEYRKENFQGLKAESEFVNKELFKSEVGSLHFNSYSEQADEDWSNVGILTKENELIQAAYTYRGKGKESTIVKITRKPETTAKEMVTDGIGLKFEVETIEKAKELVIFLSKHFSEQLETNKLSLDNVGGLLGEDDLNYIVKQLNDYDVTVSSHKNPSSNQRWQAIKLEGKIKVPENGERGRMIQTRNFEIQISLFGNENETGYARHEVYERVRKLSVFTRLFGSFSEDYLDLMCEEAYESLDKKGKKEMTIEGIKEYIKENFLYEIYKTNTQKTKFASREQIDRWEKAGILPKNIQIKK